jgi:aminocarboxymuconate-semialdehyde decarboxylase
VNIDIHNHAIPQRVFDLVEREPEYGVSLAGGTWHGPNIGDFALVEAWASPDAKLRELDGKGLDGAVVSIAPKPLYFFELPLAPQSAVAKETNLGLAEYCAVHPDRLRWMAHVPLGWPEASAEILDEAIALGASGVQVGTSAAGRRLDDPALDPFWETVERLNVPVFIHPGYELQIQAFADWNLGAIIGLPLETTIALERLVCAGHLDRYPSLRVVGAHGGGFFPYNVGRLRNYIRVRPALRDLPSEPWSYVGRIMFDSLVYDVDTLRFLVQKAGPENIMIGTDCSFSSAPIAPVDELRAAIDDDEGFRLAAGGNAAELFGFSRPVPGA